MTATLVREPATHLSPLERLEVLCDPGSVQVMRSRVTSTRMGDRAIDGDGVVGATGMVAGRPIACYAQDGSYLGGSLGERHADTIVRVLQTAERARIPVVGFVESGGARMQEGTAALGGYGRIFRHTVGLTGVVPQISIVSGSSAGGGAYSPALTDLILMTEDAAMFLTGPGVVREALGEEIDAAELGGPRVHDRNGVCHLVERDVPAAAARVRELLGYLPSAAGEAPPLVDAVEPELDDPGRVVPSEPRRVVRRARRARRDRRCRLDARAAPAVGVATSSPRWPASTGARLRSSPISRITSAACSTRSAPRRPRGSSTSATRSVCR